MRPRVSSGLEGSPMSKSFVLLFVSVIVLGACGREASAPAADPSASEETQGVLQAAQEAQKAAPRPTTAEPVDVCAMLSKEDVEAEVGPLASDPSVDSAAGSFLGGCTFVTANGAAINVSARPAHEYEGTVEYATRRGPAEKVADVGTEAVFTKVGLFVKYDDAPYFIQVLAAKTPGVWDKELSAELAKKLKR